MGSGKLARADRNRPFVLQFVEGREGLGEFFRRLGHDHL